MAKFLNTTATNYHLEELIRDAQDKLILISPYLKLNGRIKELLEDKNRLKIDVRIVYGKSDLHPEETRWLKDLEYIRISYCENLHAKCYINELNAIITSMNLYEFSQVNNNEMGILLNRIDDIQLYSDMYDEAQRIIRISEEVRISIEENAETAAAPKDKKYTKLTTSKLAQKHKLKTPDLLSKFVEMGMLILEGEKHLLTELGTSSGGEEKTSRHGKYFLWPEDIALS